MAHRLALGVEKKPKLRRNTGFAGTGSSRNTSSCSADTTSTRNATAAPWMVTCVAHAPHLVKKSRSHVSMAVYAKGSRSRGAGQAHGWLSGDALSHDMVDMVHEAGKEKINEARLATEYWGLPGNRTNTIGFALGLVLGNWFRTFECPKVGHLLYLGYPVIFRTFECPKVSY